MKSFRVNKRIILGLFIVALGLLLFINTLGILPIDTWEIINTYWPIILIVIGLLSLIDGATSNLFAVLMIAIGAFFQLKNLNYFFEHITIWQLMWPTIIIIVGMWLVFPKKKFNDTSNVLNNVAIFSGGDIVNASEDFQGGEVTAVFGGLDIDLTQAKITTNEPVIIDAFTAFGGITIKVPDHWVVEMKGLPIFGGWDNKRKNSKINIDMPPQTITVKCLVLFGGLEIK